MIIVISILTSLAGTLIFCFISFFSIKFRTMILLKFRKEIKLIVYKNRNNEKTFIFSQNEEIRISVSVLARIKKGNEYLLRSGIKSSTRQDSLYKPIGGVIQINEQMENDLGDFTFDDEKTRYTAKNNDMRIFKKLSNNKKILKILRKLDMTYYVNELKREMSEELSININEIDNIFEINSEKLFAIHNNFVYAENSFIGVNDYTHHIIFDVKIKENDMLDNLLKKNNGIKFLKLNDSNEKAITAKFLGRANKTKAFKKTNK